MSRGRRTKAQPDLFGAADTAAGRRAIDGLRVLKGFALSEAGDLLAAIGAVAEKAPFRRMVTPGGFRMSVAMTNFGCAGWVADRTGYRYQETDPESGRRWPPMPRLFADLAARAAAAAGFTAFAPDACLVNRYEPGTRLTLHQDRNERGFDQPIVSVSLGLPAIFLFGGKERSDRPHRVPLTHGDVVVWGGPSRLNFHGIAELAEGEHPATGRLRYNLTLRKAL
ncbi:MAG: DNA oxidative demethylase AlkB [Alphaproteobacteria bacterium]|nr:DNA oxidative demethylase AlkB [Alphaproteobacteria bacterium]